MSFYSLNENCYDKLKQQTCLKIFEGLEKPCLYRNYRRNYKVYEMFQICRIMAQAFIFYSWVKLITILRLNFPFQYPGGIWTNLNEAERRMTMDVGTPSVCTVTLSLCFLQTQLQLNNT